MKKIEWLHGVVLGLGDGLVTTLVTILMISNIVPHLLPAAIAVVFAGTVSMAINEYAEAHLAKEEHAVLSGVETGCAFLLGGIFPLIPIALQLPYFQIWSFGCAAIVAVIFGILKSRYSKNEVYSILHTSLFFLGIVSVATLIGIGISLILQ